MHFLSIGSAIIIKNELSKLMQNASPNAKKIMVNEFNKKVRWCVAVLSDTGTLTTIVNEAQENLNRLSLEQTTRHCFQRKQR